MLFIDIHTHHNNSNLGVLSIRNFDVNVDSFLNSEGYYSIGLHPLFLENGVSENIYCKIEEHLKNSKCLAIGECGFDKNNTIINLQVQKHIFEKLVLLSESYQKPLIIHCVGGFHLILETYKKYKPQQCWIFHGVRGHQKTIMQMLAKENFYFSFGNVVFEEKHKEILSIVPLEKCFFETDDAKIDIREVYSKYSQKQNVDLSCLIKVIENNFARCFKKSVDAK